MLVIAIVAVGSVSAAENVTTDIAGNDIEEINADEVAIDDVSTDDADEGNDEIVSQSNDQTVDSSMNSSQIDYVISQVSGAGGGTVTFSSGTYYNMNLTLKSNVALLADGAVYLVGNRQNHVIEVANVENFTISGFSIDARYIEGISSNVSAIHGSFATNGVIKNNVLYEGYNGININKKYDNLTIENNTIMGVRYDGISLANPQNNDYYDTIIGVTLRNNDISSGSYGIFIGGTFKGSISDNKIRYSNCGIQFLGKPDATSGHLNATLYNNNISYVSVGIEMFHPDVRYLNLTSNYISVYSPNYDYAISTNGDYDEDANPILVNNTIYGLISSDF